MKRCADRLAALATALLLTSAAAADLLAQRPAAARDDPLEAAAMSRAKGADDAPVTVFEIADFQCPYCARFAEEVFPAIDSAYVRTGRVQWVFVNLPLPGHREAWAASEAALCAGAVSGRFWAMHDRLFETQREWSGQADARSRFAGYARELGTDAAAYERCVNDDHVAPLLVQDVMGAAATEITGTPTFIVNREQKVVGLKTFEEWRELLDAALSREAAKRE